MTNDVLSVATELDEFRQVRDIVMKMQSDIQHLTEAFNAYAEKSEKSADDREKRLRAVESAIHSVEKITCLETEVEKLDKRLLILERNDTFSDGMNKVIYAVIGAGFAIVIVLLGWVLTLIF